MQLVDLTAVIDTLKKQLETDPDNVELLLKMADLYLKTEGEDYFNSVLMLDKVLAIEPHNFAANRIRGLIYKEQDNPEKAMECFDIILTQYAYAAEHPEYMEIRFDYADLLEEMDKIDEAVAIFEELNTKRPNYVPVLFKLAHLYEIQQNLSDAVTIYNQIMEIDPDNQSALNQLVALYEEHDKKLFHSTSAELALREGNTDKALAEYRKILPLLSEIKDESDIHKKMAMIYFIKEDYNHAIDEYSAALDLVEDDPEIYKGAGKVYFEMEDVESAIDCFTKALNLNKDDYSLHIDLADCYLDLEKFPEALRELESAKIYVPDDLDVRAGLAEGYLNIRDFYRAKQEIDFILARDASHIRALGIQVDLNIDKEDFAAALEGAKVLVKATPNSPYAARKMAESYKALGDTYNAHYNFGLAYELQGEPAMAIDEYEHALELTTEQSELLMKIGELYMNLGEKFVGMEYIERAAEANRDDVLSLTKLSEFYLETGDSFKATEAITRIVELEPRNTEALYQLASLYESQKYLEDALESYNKFLELSPTNNKADDVKKKIRGLRKKLRLDLDQPDDSLDEYEDDQTIVQKILGFFRR